MIFLERVSLHIITNRSCAGVCYEERVLQGFASPLALHRRTVMVQLESQHQRCTHECVSAPKSNGKAQGILNLGEQVTNSHTQRTTAITYLYQAAPERG